MQTPDGRACPFYYADAHRKSRVREACRLLESTPDDQYWTSGLCAGCPIPDITAANHCRTMQLHARIARPGWQLWRRHRIVVTATCTKSGGAVRDPMVGCGLCHAPLTFVVGPEATDATP